MQRHDDRLVGKWCPRALRWCCGVLYAVALAGAAGAATLAEKARESGCTSKPVAISGDLYKCVTASGADSFFNVPAGDGPVVVRRSERSERIEKQPASPAPASFPRVDPETQKGRDDLRRKVLSDELAAEQKFLAEAQLAYGNGAPAPLPEEQANAEKYRQRIARLREAVLQHERNIQALKKELGMR
jgi:hypothetical protein